MICLNILDESQISYPSSVLFRSSNNTTYLDDFLHWMIVPDDAWKGHGVLYLTRDSGEHNRLNGQATACGCSN
ncbi:hypothetical protein RJT34_33053 [Clitoria ternatea]|uniref:Uncharacterized protein n=1 Tax=Clitoria ternatea TaxID=43366 RepID=A0AAN9I2W1_CLITE